MLENKKKPYEIVNLTSVYLSSKTNWIFLFSFFSSSDLKPLETERENFNAYIASHSCFTDTGHPLGHRLHHDKNKSHNIDFLWLKQWIEPWFRNKFHTEYNFWLFFFGWREDFISEISFLICVITVDKKDENAFSFQFSVSVINLQQSFY